MLPSQPHEPAPKESILLFKWNDHFMLHEARADSNQTDNRIHDEIVLSYKIYFFFLKKHWKMLNKTIVRLGQYNVLHCQLKQSHHTAGFH